MFLLFIILNRHQLLLLTYDTLFQSHHTYGKLRNSSTNFHFLVFRYCFNIEELTDLI